MTQLQDLPFCFNNKITDEGIKHMTQIQNLNLSYNYEITDEAIKHIANCKIIRR